MEIVSIIRQAARERKVLIIEYRQKDEYAYEQRVVEPFSFRPEGTTDRLMAWDVNKQGVRSFITENIRSARMTDRPFIPKYPVEL